MSRLLFASSGSGSLTITPAATESVVLISAQMGDDNTDGTVGTITAGGVIYVEDASMAVGVAHSYTIPSPIVFAVGVAVIISGVTSTTGTAQATYRLKKTRAQRMDL